MLKVNNDSYNTALQYAPAAIKSVCLVTACFIACNSFNSEMQSSFGGFSLPSLDNNNFSFQHNFTNVPTIRHIAQPFLPNLTPINYSSQQFPEVNLVPELLSQNIESSCELAMNSLNATYQISKYVGNHLCSAIDTFANSPSLRIIAAATTCALAYAFPNGWLHKGIKVAPSIESWIEQQNKRCEKELNRVAI